MTIKEAALVVLVPEADALVGPFREKHSPSASAGMLAHITINYPFKPRQAERQLLLEELRHLFSAFPSTRFSLTELRETSDTLYLAVEPEGPFVEMAEAVLSLYPESPLYGRVSDEVVPHVTVAEPTIRTEFTGIAREFALASKGRLPIYAFADAVWLMEYEEGVWSQITAFALAK